MSNHYWDLILDDCKIKTDKSNLIYENCESSRYYLDLSALTPNIKEHIPDMPSINEALSGDHKAHFKDNNKEDIKPLVARGTWKELNK